MKVLSTQRFPVTDVTVSVAPNLRRPHKLAMLAVCGALLSQPALAMQTELISVSSAEEQGNDESFSPAISADGRYVAFSSEATNLVAGDTNGANDVFVRDRQTGMTERVSVDSSGFQANGWSNGQYISADGRFVALTSSATNLVVGDTNAVLDIFLRDRKTGTTELISVNTGGGQGDDTSLGGSVSADGRFVAFMSYATTLVANDSNGATDIFLRDRQAGTTTLVSRSSGGAQGNDDSRSALISADGRFVVFQSYATNLVAGDTNSAGDVFVYDRLTGTTERVSVGLSGQQANGFSALTSISSDARYVAFQSNATNLVAGDTNHFEDTFVRDRVAGVTTRVSVGSSGAQCTQPCEGGRLSADGRFAAFYSYSSNLVPLDTNDRRDVFIHDRLTGSTQTVSYGVSGQGSADSFWPAVSADGRFVAFASYSNNLVAGDTNGRLDIFLRDRGPQPDGRNDLLADFGAAGLWQRLNDTTWVKIHNVSPIHLAAGDLDGSLRDEVIASFTGLGLCARYDNATWKKLHNAAPLRFVAGDLDGNGSDELVADFGAAGIWARYNDATWAKLRGSTSQGLAIADFDNDGRDELVADFGTAGLWALYNIGVWAKLHNGNPKSLAVGDLDGNGQDELIVDFGGAGLWVRTNNATWDKLDTRTSQGLACGDLDGNGRDELLADFGPGGLWVRYDNGSWAKRHNGSPTRMLAADLDNNGKAEAVLDFGAAGLWVRYNDANWVKLHPAATQGLAAAGVD